MVKPDHIQKILRSAQLVFEQQDYTSATILYFKTWFALQDFLLLAKTGRAPKDHTDRFRMLQREFPLIYDALDTEFSTYRETYTRIIDEKTCRRIQQLVEEQFDNHFIE